MNITAINVFIEIDGKQCAAFISADMADVFVRMLPAMQAGQPEKATLHTLPESVMQPLQQTRKAIWEHFMAKQNAKTQKRGATA